MEIKNKGDVTPEFAAELVIKTIEKAFHSKPLNIDRESLKEDWWDLFDYMQNKGIAKGLKIAQKKKEEGKLNELTKIQTHYESLLSDTKEEFV